MIDIENEQFDFRKTFDEKNIDNPKVFGIDAPYTKIFTVNVYTYYI